MTTTNRFDAGIQPFRVEIPQADLTNDGVDFAAADPREVVGKSLSSASGFKAFHEALLEDSLLKQAPRQGGNCSK